LLRITNNSYDDNRIQVSISSAEGSRFCINAVTVIINPLLSPILWGTLKIGGYPQTPSRRLFSCTSNSPSPLFTKEGELVKPRSVGDVLKNKGGDSLVA
jgi:hypothetical protein